MHSESEYEAVFNFANNLTGLRDTAKKNVKKSIENVDGMVLEEMDGVEVKPVDNTHQVFVSFKVLESNNRKSLLSSQLSSRCASTFTTLNRNVKDN